MRARRFKLERVVTLHLCRAAAGRSVPGPESDLPRRVPVRTTVAFPKEKIPELLGALRGITVRLPAVRGTVVLQKALGTEVDVIVARSIASK